MTTLGGVLDETVVQLSGFELNAFHVRDFLRRWVVQLAPFDSPAHVLVQVLARRLIQLVAFG